jgi:hypothetical protein
MPRKSKNRNLHRAKKEQNDEHYTRLTDIERELHHYRDHFRDQVVFLNCDDPETSHFWLYFKLKFEFLGLKKLIATHYDRERPTYKLELFGYGEEPVRTSLTQNGDFRSPECVEILKEADVVVTNPPFSLAREYVAQLVEHDKKFVIVGALNWVTYKELFKLIKDNRLWLGVNRPAPKVFLQPDGSEKKFGNTLWFTNLEHKRRKEELPLGRKYELEPERYPRYDNYDAIEVSKVKDIPQDYDGVMGVPITFLEKHNPCQFSIVTGVNGGSKSKDSLGNAHATKPGEYLTSIRGKPSYYRIMIRKI